MSQITVPISATGQAIPAGSGTLEKIIVCTHSSGTVKLNDSPNSAAGRVLLDTYTFPAGSSVVLMGQDYTQGVYATIGGTATLQFVYSPTIN